MIKPWKTVFIPFPDVLDLIEKHAFKYHFFSLPLTIKSVTPKSPILWYFFAGCTYGPLTKTYFICYQWPPAQTVLFSGSRTQRTLQQPVLPFVYHKHSPTGAYSNNFFVCYFFAFAKKKWLSQLLLQLKGWDCQDSNSTKKHSPGACKTWSHFNYAAHSNRCKKKTLKMFFEKHKKAAFCEVALEPLMQKVGEKGFLAPSKRKGRIKKASTYCCSRVPFFKDIVLIRTSFETASQNVRLD